jgi:predicted DNA-binding transcriptional regulator AlpA
MDAATAPVLIADCELAAMLAVSRSHVHRLRAAGRLPAPIKLGRVTRWVRGEITEWLAAGAPSRELWEARKAMESRRAARGSA